MIEKGFEHARLAQPIEALPHTVPLAELLRKVAPGAACSRDPQHGFNKQPVVATATTRIAWFAQTMRFHLHPLGVRQNESIHQKLESHQASKGNPDSQQALALQLRFGLLTFLRSLNQGFGNSFRIFGCRFGPFHQSMRRTE